MKVRILADKRGPSGDILANRHKVIYEAEEDVAVKLTWTPVMTLNVPSGFRIQRMLKGTYCLEITRNHKPWVKVYISENQLRKLHRKLDKKYVAGIVCPTKDPAIWPLGIPSDVYLTCTDEGYLEVVKTPEWHRCVFEYNGEDLWEADRDEGYRMQHEAGKRYYPGQADV